jgi:CubicO group peptidase (beta-lactamase class C family)
MNNIKINTILAFCLIFVVQTVCFAQQNELNKLIDEIKAESKANHSTSLLIMHKGNLLVEEYDEKTPKAHNIQSITKVVGNLAIGKLISDGKISSIDVPLYNYYPELKFGLKKQITLRHILSHTSGLDPFFDNEMSEVSALQVSLAADMTEIPGERWRYNNMAINLLTGIVRKASGLEFDKYIEENIFKPIGISKVSWIKDGSGKALAFGGCELTPRQLLTFGEFAKNKGNWKGKQIVSKNWFDLNIPTSGSSRLFGAKGAPYIYSLTWKVESDESKETYEISKDELESLRKCGIEESIIKPFEKFADKGKIGKEYWDIFDSAFSGPTGNRDFMGKIRECGISFTTVNFQIIGYGHTGGGGQYLFVFPEKDLIFVRTVSQEQYEKFKEDAKNTNWLNIQTRISQLFDKL